MRRYQAAVERQHAEEAMRLGHLTIEAVNRLRSMLASIRLAFTKA